MTSPSINNFASSSLLFDTVKKATSVTGAEKAGVAEEVKWVYT